MVELSFSTVLATNYVLFVAFGIWFTLVCLIKMVGTAVQIVLSKE